MPKVEKKIVEFIEKHYWVLGFIFISVLAWIIRKAMLGFESGDYIVYLGPWGEYFKQNGGLWAIGDFEGNYNMPYITILALFSQLPVNILLPVKILSIVFDYILAIGCAILVVNLVDKNKKEYFLLTYCAVLLLPSVVINGAMWGQCDGMYVAFIILALVFLLKEKHITSFIMLGLAFSLKLQTVFILPIFVVMYFTKKNFSAVDFVIIPLVDIFLSIPAMIFGKTFSEVINAYVNQAQTYSNLMVMNFPNIYNLFTPPAETFYAISSFAAIGVCAMMLGFIISKKVEWTNEKIITLSLWFVVVVTYILPGMHERYLYLGEILVLIILIAYKKYLPLATFLLGSVLITYNGFLFGNSHSLVPLLSVVYLVLIIYFTKDVLKLLVEESKESKKVKKIKEA